MPILRGLQKSGTILHLTAMVAVGSAVPASFAAGQDSTPRRAEYRITWKRVAPLGGVIVGASFADHLLRAWTQAHHSSFRDQISSVGNRLGEPVYVLPALALILGASKLAGADGISRTAFQAGTTVAVAGSVALAAKFVVGRARPIPSKGDVDEFQPFSASDRFASFPSGHTTVAFALATSLADRVNDKWASLALYAGATLTAFARLNDDRHWLSDVVAGAMVGHLTARALDRGRLGIRPRPGGIGVSLEF